MITLLGASGYIGQAFAGEIRRRGFELHELSRRELDYTRFDLLLDYLRSRKPRFLVNAAGYTGKPNVDACEQARADTLQGNTLFPQTLAHACLASDTPWGHVSSGCIYTGARIAGPETPRIERDLTRPDLRKRVLTQPETVLGFTELDEPNFSFRQPPCSFYSGTKALAEEAIAGLGRAYVWRLRIPFDEFDNPRNYLSKVQRYPRVYDNLNSLSHRGDFVRACLDLREAGAPFGTYNVTNPGFVSTRQVVDLIRRILKPGREFEFWENDEEFYRVAAKTPRSNCILDTTKLLQTGVAMRPVLDALTDSLSRWNPEPTS
jgi:dTDP-4-dehydrorhamnose reductase